MPKTHTHTHTHTLNLSLILVNLTTKLTSIVIKRFSKTNENKQKVFVHKCCIVKHIFFVTVDINNVFPLNLTYLSIEFASAYNVFKLGSILSI